MRDDRNICLGDGLSSIPIGLLRAQSEGKVLFIVGAGVSKLSGLPLFRGLVQRVYKKLDPAVYEAIKEIAHKRTFDKEDYTLLQPSQLAEVKAFCEDEFDLTLGLLERRMYSDDKKPSLVRKEVELILRAENRKPSDLHKSIIRLSDRGNGLAVVTTNFDLLLEAAGKSLKKIQATYSIGEIMRPSLRPEFSGILHIHGSLTEDPNKNSNLILTDEDFGQHYLRGRAIPDFIYDASRIFSLVFVGYGVNDPPMKYLLSAVSADNKRFTDLKPRYAFIPTNTFDQIETEYWKGRGINPIYYNIDPTEQDHSALEFTFSRWAALVDRKKQNAFNLRELKRIVRNNPSQASEAAKDCFELIIDISPQSRRIKYIKEISKSGAAFEWLDLLTEKLNDHEIFSYAIQNQALNPIHNNIFYEVMKTFFGERSMGRDAFLWAIKGGNQKKVRRIVISDYFRNPYHWNLGMEKTYLEAWNFLVESWSIEEDYYSYIHSPIMLGERIKRGDLSLSTIKAITSHFSPRVIFTANENYKYKGKNTASNISDLISPEIVGEYNSGLKELILTINDVIDINFLDTLYYSLSCSIKRVFKITKSFGWNRDITLMLGGGIKSVTYRNEKDPDHYSRGFTAIVKLIHAIIGRIQFLDRQKAKDILRQLKFDRDAINTRLWASFASNSDLISTQEIGEFLLEIDSRIFWQSFYFPEITELRATKFSLLSSSHRKAIWRRIRTLPPKSLWIRKIDQEELNLYRYQLAFRESKRIEKEGNELPLVQTRWIEKTKTMIPKLSEPVGYPDLYEPDVTVNLVSHESGEKFNNISGADRLLTIESMLKKGTFTPDVVIWMQKPGNVLLLMDDMKNCPQFIDEYPRVWIDFCFHHNPEDSYMHSPERNKSDDFHFIFNSLLKSPSKLKTEGITAFCSWIGRWKEYYSLDEESIQLWSELLDFAEIYAIEDYHKALSRTESLKTNLNISELDRTNHFTPVGQLIDVFIQLLPNLGNDPKPFQTFPDLLRMRNRLMNCSKPAINIVLYRFTEILGYLLKADYQWTEDELVYPLTKDYPSSRHLWIALSHKIISRTILKYLGDSILEPCRDEKIDRDSRHMLLLSIVVEIINSFREERQPLIDIVKFKQLIYSLDDEARSSIVDILPKYIKEMSESNTSNKKFSCETLFRKAITPFIEAIWPKEPSLVTTSIAQAFAALPASSRTAFSEAVELIERYIIPFECYSLYSFGFKYSDNDNLKTVKEIINNTKAAESLLKLLDKAIAYSDSPIRPIELPDTLNYIKEVDPDLEYNPIYTRLEMLT